MPRDPTIGVQPTDKDPKKKTATAKAAKPTDGPSAGLAKAGVEHERGRPKSGQDRIDAGDGKPASEAAAWDGYKDAAADHAQKAQTWKDAKETLLVRLDDLQKVHEHRPFDPNAAAGVSKAAAQAVKREKDALVSKQEAKAKLDDAWETVRSFSDTEPVRPMMPDEDEP